MIDPARAEPDGGANLIPRRLIFANPERQVVRISPDGSRIAFLAPVDGVLNLWVAPIAEPGDARPVTEATDRNLGPWLVWTRDSRHVVFFRDQGGDENWRAWRVDLQTDDVRPLTPGPGVTCFIQQDSRLFPGELLIAHNERDRRHFDIYRVDVASGKSTLVQVNEGFAGYFTDLHFRVRYAVRHAETGDVEHLERREDDTWHLFVRIDADDAMATRPIEFSDDGRELCWLDSRRRDTAAVVVQDMNSGSMRTLAEDDRADFTTLLLDPVTQRPLAAASTFDRTRWQVLDADYTDDFEYLARMSAGDLALTGMSDDRRNWIVDGDSSTAAIPILLAPAAGQMYSHMAMQYAPDLDQTFRALADGTRRSMIHALARGECRSASELGRRFHSAQPTISKHLKVLEQAGLVERSIEGRLHRFRLRREPLKAAAGWLARHQTFWTGAVEQLDRLLSEAGSDDR